MNEFIILLASIIVHEAGHYFAFSIMRMKPDVRFRWFGVEIGGNLLTKATMTEMAISAEFGIIAGLLFLMAFGISNEIRLIYLLMCAIDISIIIDFLSNFKDRGLTQIGLAKKKIKFYEAKDNDKKADR